MLIKSKGMCKLTGHSFSMSEESDSDSFSDSFSEGNEEWCEGGDEESGESGESSSGEEREGDEEGDVRRSIKRGRGYVENKADSQFVAPDDEIEFVEEKTHLHPENVASGQRQRKKAQLFTIVHDREADRAALRNVDNCCAEEEEEISSDELNLFRLAIQDFSHSKSIAEFFYSRFCQTSKWKNFVNFAKQNAGRDVTTNHSELHFNELIRCVLDNSPLVFKPQESVSTSCYYCCLKRRCSFSVTIPPNRHQQRVHRENVGPECKVLAEAVAKFIHGLLTVSRKSEIDRSDLMKIDQLHTGIMEAQENKTFTY